MVTSSSVAAASAAAGWGGGVTAGFAGVAAGFGGAGTVDASTGIDVRDGAQAGVGAFTCTSAGGVGAFTSTFTGGVAAISADTDSDGAAGGGVTGITGASAGNVAVACVDPVPALAKIASGGGGGAGAFASASTGGVAAVLADTESGGGEVGAFANISTGGLVAVFADTDSAAAAGDGVNAFACGGIGLSSPALGASGGSIRDWFRRAVNASAGIGVELGTEGELGAFAWGGTGGVIPVFTETRCGGCVRLSPRNAVRASNGLRACVEPEDEP